MSRRLAGSGRYWPVAVGGLVVALAVAVPVVWYLGSPLVVNQVVNEALPRSGAVGAGTPPSESMGVAAGAQPTALSSGRFGEVDAIHKGEGAATVYVLPDGGRVLRLEGFRVTNGPDLFIYLSPLSNPRDGLQVHASGYELGRLRGNIGDQNYELPVDLDLTRVKSVVIYCKQFSVVFSTATLA